MTCQLRHPHWVVRIIPTFHLHLQQGSGSAGPCDGDNAGILLLPVPRTWAKTQCLHHGTMQQGHPSQALTWPCTCGGRMWALAHYIGQGEYVTCVFCIFVEPITGKVTCVNNHASETLCHSYTPLLQNLFNPGQKSHKASFIHLGWSY